MCSYVAYVETLGDAVVIGRVEALIRGYTGPGSLLAKFGKCTVQGLIHCLCRPEVIVSRYEVADYF